MAEAMQQDTGPIDADRREKSVANVYRRSIYGVPLTVTVSIGQRKMRVSELLELKEDAVVPLTARVDDPVDLTVDDKVIARGELIETEDGLMAVRLTEIGGMAND